MDTLREEWEFLAAEAQLKNAGFALGLLYNKLMQFMRKVALVITVSLFSLFLFALAADIGFTRVVTHPEKIKQILNDSGIYSSVVSGLLDQSKQVSSDNGDVPLSNTLVRDAANQAITQEYLKQNTNTFIDSIYHWLDGKSTTPDFLIDLTSVKTQFANNVAANLQPQLAKLPVCPASTNVQSFDAFNATCLPRGVTAEQASTTVKNDILTGKGFLEDTSITASDLKSSDSNQPIFTNKLKDAPKAYQKAKNSQFVLAILVLLIAVAIIFLSPTRRTGFKRAGITLLTIGFFMLIFAWGLNRGSNEAISKLKLDNVVLQEKVKILARDIVREVDKSYWIVGATYAVIGAASIAGASFLFKGNGSGSGDTPAHRPSASDKPDDSPAPASKPPTRKKILVQ